MVGGGAQLAFMRANACVHACACVRALNANAKDVACAVQSGCTRRATTEHGAEIIHQPGQGSARRGATQHGRDARARHTPRTYERAAPTRGPESQPCGSKTLTFGLHAQGRRESAAAAAWLCEKITRLLVIGGDRLDEAVLQKVPLQPVGAK